MTEGKIIVFYGTKYCPDCYHSRKILNGREISYEYIDINRNAEAKAYVEQVNNGNRSVPTIVFPDGDVLVEPSRKVLHAKLDTMRIMQGIEDQP
jgi:mycoredoxin